jgi:hypothetical protein
MFEQRTHLVGLGLGDFGSGFSSLKSSVFAFLGLLVLALLAWWTTRPARRAARPQRPTGSDEVIPLPTANEYSGGDVTRAKQTRKAR